MENFAKMLNFAARCQAWVPDWMHKAFARAETDADAYLLSVSIACDQCDALIAEGVEHLHFYTLNNPDLTFDVCRTLGYVAAPLAAARGPGRPERGARRPSPGSSTIPASAQADALAHGGARCAALPFVARRVM